MITLLAHQKLRHTSGFYPSGSLTKIMYAFLICQYIRKRKGHCKTCVRRKTGRRSNGCNQFAASVLVQDGW